MVSFLVLMSWMQIIVFIINELAQLLMIECE